MAKIGLKYPVYAPATVGATTMTYAAGAVLAKAIGADISIQSNKVKLPADDGIAESDQSFASGTVKLEIDELSNSVSVALFNYSEGATADAGLGTKVLTANGNTSPGYVGLGFYGKKVVNGVNCYRAIWLNKVQFSEPADTFATKGEVIVFNTHSIEGEIMLDPSGDWKDEATFSSESAAQGWLEIKAGITTPDALTASCVPADSAINVAVTANVVLTFNNKISTDSVTLIDADGAVVASARAYDTAGKVLTINPTASLAASTVHHVVVSGAVDIYGQALATTTFSFTTAA